MTVITIALLEVGVRGVIAFRVHDPNVLLYPFQPTERTRFGRVFGNIQPDRQMDPV